MLFVLDTNMLSELLKANERIVRRFESVPLADEVVTNTISRFEILRGRYTAILTAADKPQLLLAHERLHSDEIKLSRFRLLPVTPRGADRFEELLQKKKLKKIGREDLLIACIALAHDATLVTRNTKDFTGIPGLKVENWSN